MTTVKKNAWLNFQSVIENFLGSKKTQNYKEIISAMLQNFKVMSLKVHFLFSHLD